MFTTAEHYFPRNKGTTITELKMNGSNAIPEMHMAGNVAENWIFWKKRFLNYIKAAEITKKEEATQCALLLHLIGPEGNRIYSTFVFAQNETDKLAPLIKKFDDHFLPRENTSFERYKFFIMRQNGSTIEQFVTALRDQANKCKFDQLKDGLIKCMLICGVNSTEMREKLLEDDSLTLEQAIHKCNAIAEAKEQSTQIRDGNKEQDNVHAIHKTGNRENLQATTSRRSHTYNRPDDRDHSRSRQRTRSSSRSSKYSNRPTTGSGKTIYNCRNCSKSHLVRQCSAYGKECSSCGKLNHFAIACRSRNVRTISKDQNSDIRELNFTQLHIDSIEVYNIDKITKSWVTDLEINGKIFRFKIDTGADANVIPLTYVNKLGLPESIVEPSTICLRSYTGDKLDVIGTCWLYCQKDEKNYTIPFYVINTDNALPILGLETCILLNLIKRIDAMQKLFPPL